MPRLQTLSTLVSVTTLFYLFQPLQATAQITPDNSLGNESSVFVPNVEINGINSDRIDGGAIRGSNLFHSFQEFNIDNGRGAYFSDPGNIINILSRVTGNNPSNILGTLGVLGNANLFLINPNGIVFGPNARLDVSGSFFASTADGILFENGVEFAASNPDAPPLLTINIPIGLNFRENPGSIVNQSVEGLQVESQKTLGLIGGEVRFENGGISSSGSRIELGGLSEPGIVELNTDGSLSFPTNTQRADVLLTDGAFAGVAGNPGGSVAINARNLEVFGGSLVINGVNNISNLSDSEVEENIETGIPQAGDITINATESVRLTGQNSIVANQVLPDVTGNAGNINIQTNFLSVTNGAQISTSTLSNGNGGDITINATDVELLGNGSGFFALVQLEASGTGGNITIDTQRLRVEEGAGIIASTFGNGDAGDINIEATDIELIGTFTNNRQIFTQITTATQATSDRNGGDLTINTQRLILRDGAQITSGTSGAGNAGNLTIQADSIEVIGRSIDRLPSTIAASAEQLANTPRSTGNGGDLTIDTRLLSVQDGGVISVGTGGDGDAGNLTIRASEVEVNGVSQDSQASSSVTASTRSGSTGDGGTLTIDTQSLRIQDGAQVDAATFGNGDGGNLVIRANAVEVTGTDPINGSVGSTLSARTQSAGNGGSLTVDTQTLVIADGAQVDAVTFGNGDAGNLTVNAADIKLIGTSSFSQAPSGLFTSAEPGSIGAGGQLTVNTDNLTIRDGAIISVRSESTEAAGNLIINAPNIFLDHQASINGETTAGEGNITLHTSDLRLRNNSSITTNATGEATGGNITINTETLTALEDSDISANAEDAFGGRVTINAAGIFGTTFRTQQSRFSDITATSELGPEFSGTVELNTELDPSSGLIDLSQTVVDPSDLIAQEFCRQRGGSEFVVTGKGGIAADPNDKADGNQIEVDLVEPVPSQPRNTSRRRSEIEDNQPVSSLDIIPARGWIRDENGDVILVGYDPTKTGIQRQPSNSHPCQNHQ